MHRKKGFHMNQLKNAIRNVQLPRINSLVNGCFERQLDVRRTMGTTTV